MGITTVYIVGINQEALFDLLFAEGLVHDNLLFVESFIQDNTVNQCDMAPALGIMDAGVGTDDETYDEPPLSPIWHFGSHLSLMDCLMILSVQSSRETRIMTTMTRMRSNDFPHRWTPVKRGPSPCYLVGSAIRMVERLE